MGANPDVQTGHAAKAGAERVPVQNADIERVFDQIADLLEIEGANPFRVRAYRTAARTIAGLPRGVAAMLDEGADLTDLPGIGKDLAAKIAEIVATGRLSFLDELQKKTPKHLVELLALPGLGPKRVQALHEQLGIDTIAALARAAKAGRVATLRGFSPALEQKLLHEIDRQAGTKPRTLRIAAEQTAAPLVAYLEAVPGVSRVIVAGSYRRRSETVGDLDILATCEDAGTVMDRFVRYPGVADVLAQGPSRSTVVLRNGLQVDLRVVPDASYGAALVYFTGSKAHNIAIRRMAQDRGLKINEYGVFAGDRRVAGATEADVYARIGLPFIEPELREDRGEIAAALAGTLPKLVTSDDIRGDLHVHTVASDGHDSIEAMAKAARDRGYDYIAITDHTRHATIAHGLDAKRLARQIREIDRLAPRLKGITVLKSAEVDILKDGRLDLSDDILAELDFTVCAIHSNFDLPRAAQTERLLRAMDNRHFTILAHPSGRLLNKRLPYEVDMERVLAGARERNRVVELNAQPERLDLTDTFCQLAKDIGLKIAVSTDAHSAAQLDTMRLGVDQARRGWLTAADVVNTRRLADLRRLLR